MTKREMMLKVKKERQSFSASESELDTLLAESFSEPRQFDINAEENEEQQKTYTPEPKDIETEKKEPVRAEQEDKKSPDSQEIQKDSVGNEEVKKDPSGEAFLPKVEEMPQEAGGQPFTSKAIENGGKITGFILPISITKHVKQTSRRQYISQQQYINELLDKERELYQKNENGYRESLFDACEESVGQKKEAQGRIGFIVTKENIAFFDTVLHEEGVRKRDFLIYVLSKAMTVAKGR